MKKTVAVIFGGASSEYNVSLASASSVLKNINKDKYKILMIGITKKGDFYLYNGNTKKIEEDKWLNDNVKKITISTNRCDKGIIIIDTKEVIKIDVAFIMLHGQNGEDGRLQGLFELAGIKYIGSDMLASALCMDKYLSKKLVEEIGIKVPKNYFFTKANSYEEILEQINNLKYPLFVKPLRAGSSFGITKIDNLKGLKKALKEAFIYDDKIIIEEEIKGFEVGCAIIGNEDIKIGEVDEIELQTPLFDYYEKYNLKTSKIHLPARISNEERKRVQMVALKIYRKLGCKDFARVDMFYTSDKQIIFNEVNTLPGFTIHSRYPNMLKMTNLSFEKIIDNLIELGLTK